MAKMKKIKNCFMDEQPNFEFDVVVDDDVIAKCHALTPRDWSYIKKHAYGKLALEDGEVKVDIDPYQLQICMVYKALDEWAFDRPIGIDSVNVLGKKYREAIYEQINKHEEEFNANKEAIAKNS